MNVLPANQKRRRLVYHSRAYLGIYDRISNEIRTKNSWMQTIDGSVSLRKRSFVNMNNAKRYSDGCWYLRYSTMICAQSAPLLHIRSPQIRRFPLTNECHTQIRCSPLTKCKQCKIHAFLNTSNWHEHCESVWILGICAWAGAGAQNHNLTHHRIISVCVCPGDSLQSHTSTHTNRMRSKSYEFNIISAIALRRRIYWNSSMCTTWNRLILITCDAYGIVRGTEIDWACGTRSSRYYCVDFRFRETHISTIRYNQATYSPLNHHHHRHRHRAHCKLCVPLWYRFIWRMKWIQVD